MHQKYSMEVALLHVAQSNLKYSMFDFLGCPFGFFGKDCSKKCKYPFYGEDCQSTCRCFKHDCHVSRGCLKNFETSIYQNLSMYINIISKIKYCGSYNQISNSISILIFFRFTKNICG